MTTTTDHHRKSWKTISAMSCFLWCVLEITGLGLLYFNGVPGYSAEPGDCRSFGWPLEFERVRTTRQAVFINFDSWFAYVFDWFTMIWSVAAVTVVALVIHRRMTITVKPIDFGLTALTCIMLFGGWSFIVYYLNADATNGIFYIANNVLLPFFYSSWFEAICVGAALICSPIFLFFVIGWASRHLAPSQVSKGGNGDSDLIAK